MGHAHNMDREYRLLQRRLDGHVTGAPESPALDAILRILFRPDDLALARRLPIRLTPLDILAGRLRLPADELAGRISDMAARGLVIDAEHQGRRYVSLAPIVIGFFEFTFMRARDDAPLAELARLFEEYMALDDRFARAVFQGETQIARSLVREDALPEVEYTEVLDWERASRIVESASSAAVSLCACRHKASHLGTACDAPQEVCLSLNYGAEVLVRHGLARPLAAGEAMGILERYRQLGLAQTADNVQRKVSFICNCCGCCCELFRAVRQFDIRHGIVSSNWVAQVEPAACKGCGKCAAACPIGALSSPAEKAPPACDGDLCLGCGLCAAACRFGAVRMAPRTRRVFTPETAFDRVVAMAIERGKLAPILFSDPERLSHRALGRIAAAVERSVPYKAAMAVAPLRSAFFRALVAGARRASGTAGEVVAPR